MNHIKNIFKKFAVILILLVSIGGYAQVNKTAGTRITDVTIEKKLSETAILDLDSSTRGFFMPRMSTAQRDQLEKKLLAEVGIDNTGIVIYNTTNDCVEYWHSSTAKWRSLCGSLPPAKLDLEGGCEDIEIDASIKIAELAFPSWQQGLALTDKNLITVRVYVSSPGTYSISADSGNGYFFTAEGQFQSEGIYRIVLKGMGTPRDGYDQAGAGKKGDKLRFTFNGIESKKCVSTEIAIKPAELKLTIDNAVVYDAAGKYYVGQEATGDLGNKIDIQVSVGVIGSATITATNDVVGLSFTGTKVFTQDGKYTMTLFPVRGKATPLTNAAANYDLVFRANVKESDMAATINGAKAKVVVEGTEISMDPTKIDFGKEPFFERTAINAKNILTVPVKVIGSGTATLKLTNAEGVEFEARDVVLNKLANDNDTQNVTFLPVVNNKPMPSTPTSVFTLSGTGNRFKIIGGTTVTIKLERKAVAYTFDCNTITSNRTTMPINEPIKELYYIIVPVMVTEIGEYEMNTTGSVEGIKFSSTRGDKVKKKFSKTGPDFIHLYPIEGDITLTKAGDYTLGLTVNDESGNTGCSQVKVKVGLAGINVLHFAGDNNRPSVFGFEPFLLGKDEARPTELRFGPKGVIAKTGVVTYERYKYSGNAATEVNNIPENRKALAARIKAGTYNLIVMDGFNPGYALDDDLLAAITTYVQAGKALVLASGTASAFPNEEYDVAALKVNVNSPTDAYGTYRNTANATKFYKMYNDGVSMYTSGGAASKNGSVIGIGITEFKGPYLFKTGSNAVGFTANNSLGLKTSSSNFIPLVTLDANNDNATALRHKTRLKQFWLIANESNGGYSNFDWRSFTPSGLPTDGPAGNNSGRFSANIIVHLMRILTNE